MSQASINAALAVAAEIERSLAGLSSSLGEISGESASSASEQPQQSSSAPSYSSPLGPFGGYTPGSAPEIDNLYVKGLPSYFTEEGLRQFFSKFCTVVRCKMLPMTPGKHGASGFVRCRDSSEALSVIERLNQTIPDGLHDKLIIRLAGQPPTKGKGGEFDKGDKGKGGKGKGNDGKSSFSSNGGGAGFAAPYGYSAGGGGGGYAGSTGDMSQRGFKRGAAELGDPGTIRVRTRFE